MPTPGARFDELVRVMGVLRSPDGCPWDRAQTLQSLRPFLLEETYEVLEALDQHDSSALREELGDLLFEVVFLSRISEESGGFSVVEAIESIIGKLVRRHPHVFGDAAKLTTSSEVLRKWEEIKAAEGETTEAPKTTLGGVPKTLPALLRAHEYGCRAAAVGFDWTRAADVVDKIQEEVSELRGAVEQIDHTDRADRIEEEIGDLLFALANLSRKLGVEPESALRRANDKFLSRFSALEARMTSRGKRLQDETLDALELEWQAVKRAESR
jgi:MazG family protein